MSASISAFTLILPLSVFTTKLFLNIPLQSILPLDDLMSVDSLTQICPSICIFPFEVLYLRISVVHTELKSILPLEASTFILSNSELSGIFTIIVSLLSPVIHFKISENGKKAIILLLDLPVTFNLFPVIFIPGWLL